MNKSSFGHLQKPFNQGFGRDAVRYLRRDHIVLRIVSANRSPLSKFRRVFVDGAITLATIGMYENRTTFRIGVTGRNRGERKQNHALAEICALEAMSTG